MTAKNKLSKGVAVGFIGLASLLLILYFITGCIGYRGNKVCGADAMLPLILGISFLLIYPVVYFVRKSK